MKALKYIAILFAAIVVIHACDEVEDPYAHIVNAEACDCEITDSSLITIKENEDFAARRLLLEEYTGIQCGNCPIFAQDKIKRDLVKEYGDDSLVVVAIQANASPLSEPDDKHTYDMRIPAGGEYSGAIENGSTIPYVLIHGKESAFKAGGDVVQKVKDLVDDGSWHDAEPLELNLRTSYSSECRSLLVELDATTKSDVPAGANVIIYLLENGIIAPQTFYATTDMVNGYLWYEHPDFPYRYNYEHNHVLRATWPSPWGESMFDPSTASGSSESMSWELCLDEEFVAENCDLVAVVYDLNTKAVLGTEIIHHLSE
jgi:hypothetical protein